MTVFKRTLPTVVDDICADIPSYLTYESEVSKSTQLTLNAAFKDIFSQQIDWARYSSLVQASPDPLHYCLNSPIRLNNCDIHVLGIAHSSLASCQHVNQAIHTLKPEVLALESDVERTFGRTSIQLPLVQKFNCDWKVMSDLGDLGGDGPKVDELARVGLYDLKLGEEAATFLAMIGSFTGSPEISCLHACNNLSIPLVSVDLLERLKRVQNQSLESVHASTKKIGDLPESILRHVTDDQGILREYFRLVYGVDRSSPSGSILPTTLYRLCELKSRASPADDFILRELHRVFRPREFFSRIFLRDVYMAARVNELSHSKQRILLICGASHVEGIRDLLSQCLDQKFAENLKTTSLACLLSDGDLLVSVWRDFFGLEPFEPRIPHILLNETRMILMRRLIAGSRVGVWQGRGWQVETVSDELIERQSSDSEWVAHINCRYDGFWDKLFNGEIDPYTYG